MPWCQVELKPPTMGLIRSAISELFHHRCGKFRDRQTDHPEEPARSEAIREDSLLEQGDARVPGVGVR